MTLPDGFRVRLADGVLTAGRGRLLVGGSPLTAVRLSERACDLLRDGGVTVLEAESAHLAERLVDTNVGVPDLTGAPTVAVVDLTVVIPVRDRPEHLDRALSGLAGLRCLVVDDASHRPASVAAVAGRHGAEVLPLPSNVGPAGARNAGLARVRTPYVAFVDSDVEITVAELLSLTRHFADPAVALVGPRVVGASRSARPRWFERYEVLASSLTLGRTPGCVRPGAAVAWLPSACLVGRSAVLTDDRVGGFDADLRVGEDVDLVWRLVAEGHRVRYAPEVEARHDTRATIQGWLGRKFYYGTGGAALASRHGDLLAPAVLTPTYAVAGAALLLRRRWSLPAAALALVSGTRSVRGTLPDVDGRGLVAARLAGRGLGWAVRQESALLLRHWWPLGLLGALVSRHVRRALPAALVVDAAVALAETRRLVPVEAPLGVVRLLAARRLDDLAYGAGLWWGALRQGSPRVLLPRRPGKR